MKKISDLEGKYPDVSLAFSCFQRNSYINPNQKRLDIMEFSPSRDSSSSPIESFAVLEEDPVEEFTKAKMLQITDALVRVFVNYKH
jgi:hypothetical protein